MLILAGVSLNAIIGDNGIITNAQDANFKSGMAVLEEFLQQKYIECYDYFDNEESKIDVLQKMYPQFFYIPSSEGIGALKYIIDSNGNAFYLLKKSGLPQEIKEELYGGDAGDKTYSDYYNLNDVYGVTSDLKVYYAKNGKNSIIGLTQIELDMDDPGRVAFANISPFTTLLSLYDKFSVDTDGKLIDGADGIIQAEEIKSITSLKINLEDGINNLSELYNLTSLKQLILEGLTLDSLEGIQNAMKLSQVYIKTCTIGDYGPLGQIGNRLKKLYFYNIDDYEMDKILGTYDEEKETGVPDGISKYDLTNLQYLGFSSSGYYFNDELEESVLKANYAWVPSGASKKITKVSQLNNLTNSTKLAINYLFINNNLLTNLNGIGEMSNLYLLRCEGNNIKSLLDIKNLNLTYLFACNNKLGIDEKYDLELMNNGKDPEKDALVALQGHSKLTRLDITQNNDLKYISYLRELSNLEVVYLTYNLNYCDVSEINNLVNQCGSNFYIDNKYYLSLLNEDIELIDVHGQTLTIDNLISIGKCKKVKYLNLDNVIVTGNDGSKLTESDINTRLQTCLSGLTNIIELGLNGAGKCQMEDIQGNISSFDFISNYPKGSNTRLIEIDMRNTKITDLLPLNQLVGVRALMINNSSCTLSSIVDLINNANGSVNGTFAFTETLPGELQGSRGGLVLEDSGLLSQLNNLTGLTQLWMCGGYYNYGTIDLSNINHMNSLGLYHLNIEGLKLPKSLNILNLDYVGPATENTVSVTGFSKSIHNSIWFSNYIYPEILGFVDENTKCTVHSGRDTTTLIQNIPSDVGIELTLQNAPQFGTINTNILGIKKLNLIALKSVTDLNTISKMKNLEFLSISNRTWITNGNFTKGLTKLTTLSLDGCSITDVSFLYNLPALITLNLKNTPIYNRFSYIDENNVSHTNISTLGIIAGLNVGRGGNLQNVFLEGCDNLTNFDELKATDLIWTNKNGF